MTKKDYIAIAQCLRMTRPVMNSMYYGIMSEESYARANATVDDAAQHLCAHMERDNPRFDRARFLAACGVQS
jgi:hypothetical protein